MKDVSEKCIPDDFVSEREMYFYSREADRAIDLLNIKFNKFINKDDHYEAWNVKTEFGHEGWGYNKEKAIVDLFGKIILDVKCVHLMDEYEMKRDDSSINDYNIKWTNGGIFMNTDEEYHDEVKSTFFQRLKQWFYGNITR